MPKISVWFLPLALLMGCGDNDGIAPPDAMAFAADATPPDAAPLDAGLPDAPSPMDATPDASATLTAYVRVHLISSEVEDLDATGIYTVEALDVFMTHINETFAQANIEWEVESVRMQPALNEEAYRNAIAAEETGAVPLRRNIDPAEMLAPRGWDVFVVRRTSPLGFGGVYTCTVNREPGLGAVFVPLLNAAGGPQQARKWTHELGHATGLQHPACEAIYADNLMMSGGCEHSERERRDLAPGQIARIQEQVMLGGPARCGTLITGFE